MPNRFGLKDLVLMLLAAGALLVVLLNMLQNDRFFKKLVEVEERQKQVAGQVGQTDNALREVTTQLQSVRERVDAVARAFDEGVTVRVGSGTGLGAGAGAGASGSGTASLPAGQRDESWARPGAAVQWQGPVAPATDPRATPNFREGGEVTEIWEAQLKTLHPYIATDVYGRRVHELVLESLGVLDPKSLEYRGQLAEAWQVDPEGLWLRARLRSGVRFSDGVPLTAEDVRWTYHDFVLNEQIECERVRSIVKDVIKQVTVIDERTVEFAFHERLFSNVDVALSLFVLPRHVYAAMSASQINGGTGVLVGSGPFRLRNSTLDNQWAPPSDIVLERNERYWGPRPALASLRYQAINEEIGRLNTFFKGDADIITPSAPQFVAKQEDPDWAGRAAFLKWVNMRSGYSFVAWNCGERNGKLTPFHDRRVRLAMTHALDREKLIRDIYRGVGTVAKGMQPLNAPGSNPDIEPWPFDLKRAAELFREAGWEDRDGDGVLEDKLGNALTLEFTYASGSEIGERIAKFIADAYKNAGVRVTLRGMEWTVYQDVLKTRDFDAITLGWGASAPESDPRQIFHSEAIKNQGDNFAQWANAEADRLIEAGRRELDAKKRALIWRELERVLHEEQPYTFVRTPPWLRLVGPAVGNLNMYPKGLEPAEYFRLAPSAPTPGL